MQPPPAIFRLMLGASLAWQVLPAAAPPGAPLEWFLPDEAAIQRLQPTIAQLESESFAERQAASRELAELPALPGFIRELAAKEPRAESRLRLRVLTAAFPIEKENDRLTRILQDLTKDGTKGQLAPLCQLMASGIWTPTDAALHEAARATASSADLPLLEDQLKSPSPVLRRIAAAGLGGLPPAESTDRLVGLLADDDPATAILAATELAARRDVRALAAFARLLNSPDFQVRHHCHAALRGLTQQDFGYDPSADRVEREQPTAKWREWVGSDAAAITGAVPKDASIALFNGQDLQGWEIRVGNLPLAKSDAWEVIAGELHCTGKRIVATGDLWTKARFENYVLNLEYQAAAADSDSGVGLLLTEAGEAPATPKYLEVQLLPGSGGDLYQIGGIEVAANGKPIAFQSPRIAEVKDRANAWHKLQLSVRDGTVEVELDGVIVNRTSKGPRGPGRIVLRNEGSTITFRNLLLRPLPAPPGARRQAGHALNREENEETR